MFCTSLRARKQWASAVPHLIQHDKLKFRENKLDTHDVNLPLPSSAPGQRYLRFALLSCADGDSAYKHQRVERLYHQSGGRDAAIIWLLGERGDAASFMQFQIEQVSHHIPNNPPSHGHELTRMQCDRLLDTFELPLIPLPSLDELPATLLRFHRSFLQADAPSRRCRPRGQNRLQSTAALQTLLPFSVISPPLSEHGVNLLGDLTASFADLANKVSTEAGQAEILDFFGQAEAERIILFWTQECLL